MGLTSEDIFGTGPREPLEVAPPGASKAVRLRWPSFGEWHALALKHRKLEGKEPPADLICETIATCVATPDGKRRMTNAEASVLLESDSRLVMWLYVKCWDTVLKSNDDEIGGIEKN